MNKDKEQFRAWLLRTKSAIATDMVENVAIAYRNDLKQSLREKIDAKIRMCPDDGLYYAGRKRVLSELLIEFDETEVNQQSDENTGSGKD